MRFTSLFLPFTLYLQFNPVPRSHSVREIWVRDYWICSLGMIAVMYIIYHSKEAFVMQFYNF